MIILHYTLGFFPTRTGGLVEYASDLISEEKKMGNKVYSLFPGRINILKKTYIKKTDDPTIFELFNSLPLPIFNGIGNSDDFCKAVDEKIYIEFLKSLNLDIIHVHTLMGIHKEFFKAANFLKIPIVYTSHDYFGISPTPTFFKEKSYDNCEDKNEVWSILSANAMSVCKLRFFQLSIYSSIRKIFSKTGNFKNKVSTSFNERISIGNYKRIINYYRDIFSMITFFHFNSNLAKQVFFNNLGNIIKKYAVLSISNCQVKKRDIRFYNSKEKRIRIAYIGPDKREKGFFEFLKLIVKNKNRNFEFKTFGYTPKRKIKDLEQNGKYNISGIKDVYNKIDVLIVPSLWKETFGFIVPEALSFGKIVFVSENVGSKDIIGNDFFVFKNIEELSDKLNSFNGENDINYNLITMKEHANEINELYKKLLR
ncbi:glycosyltransferase [Liquorilactobacillus hordei]|uniref:glycosyltransferase n=1 Tax=Liquorilactobacillus hordei TaxID=468911 RepID=UPI001CC09ECC|nr:glycosyltransferase [Liquorilactobacillus hordei]MBZ2405261.1 glycosyl transferase family 1 [Liquorilactobacillus hordei]